MVQKTNQFNFTTKRYSKIDLINLIECESSDFITCRVEDRFGGYGVTALIVILKNEKSYHIDSFLMSCRILGKKVENVLLNWYLSNRYDGDELTALYKPTLKNKQLDIKYLELGFDVISESELETTYLFKEIEEINLSVEVNVE